MKIITALLSTRHQKHQGGGELLIKAACIILVYAFLDEALKSRASKADLHKLKFRGNNFR
jgi:hypothetical protein